MPGAEIQCGRRLLLLRIGDSRLKALAKLFLADKPAPTRSPLRQTSEHTRKTLAAIPGTDRFGKSNASRRSAAAAW